MLHNLLIAIIILVGIFFLIVFIMIIKDAIENIHHPKSEDREDMKYIDESIIPEITKAAGIQFHINFSSYNDNIEKAENYAIDLLNMELTENDFRVIKRFHGNPDLYIAAKVKRIINGMRR